MDDSSALSWREIVEKHQAAMVEEITVRLDSQLQRAILHAVESERASASESVERTRVETAEFLNQALRRLRQVAARSGVLELLAESSARYSEQTAVLSIHNHQCQLSASRGLISPPSSPPSEDAGGFPIETAPAIASAVESKDPVITLASATEISALLADAFGSHPDRKAYLFPILTRQNVTGMLVACGQVAGAPLELLCEAAGMRLDGLAADTPPAPAPLPGPALVQIGAQTGTASARTWDQLSPEDQQLHLKAQRTARIRVAEIRLYQGDALRKGAAAGDIYGNVGAEIDAARTEFLQTFLSKSPTMVDYLHLEILRSLAHDDDRLLGEKYPGPMV
jgi:hypothetical protein